MLFSRRKYLFESDSKLEKKLLKSIRENDLTSVRDIVSKHINSIDIDKGNFLKTACEKRFFDIIEYLYKKGFNPENAVNYIKKENYKDEDVQEIKDILSVELGDFPEENEIRGDYIWLKPLDGRHWDCKCINCNRHRTLRSAIWKTDRYYQCPICRALEIDGRIDLTNMTKGDFIFLKPLSDEDRRVTFQSKEERDNVGQLWLCKCQTCGRRIDFPASYYNSDAYALICPYCHKDNDLATDREMF